MIKENEIKLKDKISMYLESITDGKLVVVNQDWRPVQFNISKEYFLTSSLDNNKESQSAKVKRKTLRDISKEYIDLIVKELGDIQFGHLAIIIENGLIVKLEKEEKSRIKYS